VLKNSNTILLIQLAASIAGFERNLWSDRHECHLESFYCSVDHRRQLHNRRCIWQKKWGGSEARKPRSLKSGGLKPSSLIEVYAYVTELKKVQRYVKPSTHNTGARETDGQRELLFIACQHCCTMQCVKISSSQHDFCIEMLLHSDLNLTSNPYRVTTLQTMWNSLMVRGTPPLHSACLLPLAIAT